ncbi:hypothetical protein ACP275_07G091700 [Erythranthe tilingii]
MSRVYDSWERLVAAVLDKQHLRYLALCESFDTSISVDFSSSFSFFEDETTASRISSNAISLGATSNPVKYIEFEELKKATQNFRSYSNLGEGAFGHFSKGWIDENTLTASKPGFGTPVAVKKWRRLEGLNDCLYIEFEELKKKGTENIRSYSDIGEGRFSNFRRGWIDKHILTASKPGFQSAVAVKMFKRFEGGFNGCLNEIGYLSRFRHPNIVKLIGYCYEDDIILVYEFIPKGSLDRHLVRESRDQTLPWATRIKVAVGAARALAFLYYNKNPIVHQSFNTADILLDGEFNAKLCNFGLATDVSDSDIECVATGAHLIEQSDVYKFGVFLVDLISGRSRNRSIYDYNHTSVDWAKPYLGDDRKFVRIMDPKLRGQFPHNAAFTVATIALRCLNEIPEMAEVLVSLEHL